ncbi:MAG: hypothetical protein LBV12_06130 [Puniceicoccales bacterium]|jgi:zona occludens toxin (predicted ATPase)|nr:hypothetical protein [Puniceicoccales bacterium]
MNKSTSEGTAVMLLLMLAMSLVAGVGFVAFKQHYFTGRGLVNIQTEPGKQPDSISQQAVTDQGILPATQPFCVTRNINFYGGNL